MSLHQHRCRRFERRGIPCPFRRTRGHQDDDDEEFAAERQKPASASRGFRWEDVIRSLALGRGRRGQESQGRFKGFPREVPAPVGVPEEEARRIPAADPRQIPLPLPRTAIRFQEKGGLSFLPDMRQLLREPSPQALIAVISSLLLMEGLRRSGGTPFGTPGQVVSRLESASTGQLRQLSSMAPGQGGRTRGRGGFHVDAASQLRGDLGLAPSRRQRKKKEESETFSGDFFLTLEGEASMWVTI